MKHATYMHILSGLEKTLVDKCKSFAESIFATRLSAKLVHHSVMEELHRLDAYIDPEILFDRVRIALENDGIELK